MAHGILRTRERLISSWTKGRLGERGAVEWAVKAMQRIRSDLGQDTIDLLRFLSEQARESNDLSPQVKTTWRLLYLAANNRSTQAGWTDLYDLERKIRGQRFTPEDINRLIDCMRPRLLASPLSDLAKRGEGEENPVTWMSWEFKAACGSLDRWASKLGHKQIALLPTPDVERVVSLATLALSDALRSAREIGWIDSERDFPNHLVHRVVLEKEHLAGGETNEDPDKYNSNFAPIVRLLSWSFIVLLQRNVTSARRIAEEWRSQEGGLFLRLTAFSMWHTQIAHGEDIGEFLRSASEQVFWRWIVFPEVASLRGLRWPDLPAEMRSELENRLWSGPNQKILNWPEETADLARLYHRDHEVARLVDACYAIPDPWVETIRSRREADIEFPTKVGPIEAGLPGPKVGWVPEGSGERFRDVPVEELLEALAADKAQRKAFAGDDGEAFAKSLEGKGSILDALEQANSWNSNAELAFELLISYPDGGKDDLDYFRSVVERTARLALEMPSTTFVKMADRLGYWLDAVDAHTQGFTGANELWHLLLPYAEMQANSKILPDSSDGAVDEADLTTAALNEPFGNLISYFLRRAPVLSKKDNSRLPTEFVEPLKKVTGRASELLANRMALSMSYFHQVDPDWLRQLVLEPMLSGGDRGNRLWEAFAKYSQIPSAEIWKMLEAAAFRQLPSQFLSPEARHNLAEMAVTVWAWSKIASSRYKASPDKLRTALTLAKDDVRAAAAWRYLRLIESEKREDDVDSWALIGSAFFQEVWPLEAMLQAPATSKPLAAVPAAAGLGHFADAVRTVLTNLRPFEVWAVSTEIGIDEDNQDDREIIKAHPEELLRLLAACITEEQVHKVYDLGNILGQIEKAEPSLQGDPRMRQLRKLA